MTTLQIVVPYVVWVVVTYLIIAVARQFRTERSSLYAGVTFLAAAFTGILSIYHVFELELQCQASTCWADKARADTLIQFVLITWGALAGSLLAKIVENREPAAYSPSAQASCSVQSGKHQDQSASSARMPSTDGNDKEG
jgi:hypothetical protein